MSVNSTYVHQPTSMQCEHVGFDGQALTAHIENVPFDADFIWSYRKPGSSFWHNQGTGSTGVVAGTLLHIDLLKPTATVLKIDLPVLKVHLAAESDAWMYNALTGAMVPLIREALQVFGGRLMAHKIEQCLADPACPRSNPKAPPAGFAGLHRDLPKTEKAVLLAASGASSETCVCDDAAPFCEANSGQGERYSCSAPAAGACFKEASKDPPVCGCLAKQCSAASMLVAGQEECAAQCARADAYTGICGDWDDMNAFCDYYGVWFCVQNTPGCARLPETPCEARCRAEAQSGKPEDRFSAFLMCWTSVCGAAKAVLV